MDKILRIDMGADGGPKASETGVGDYAGLGGRALTSAVVSKEVPPLCHPLGEGPREDDRDEDLLRALDDRQGMASRQGRPVERG